MTTQEAMTNNVFRMPLTPRWRDLDAFNHVNNSNYFTYLEEARIQWFATIGEEWVNDDFAPVIASATLNYRLPIDYPSQVVIELFTERLGNTSVTIGHRILGENGALHCDGHVVAVWIQRASGKPMALPPGVRRAAERLLSK